MEVVYDPPKDVLNRKNHKISLARAADMDMALATVKRDERHDYGEQRFRAWGPIDDAIYCLAFTIRDGVIRAISLRRAHAKEIRKHASRA